MNLFTRKMRLFCVSNIMVSFVCTGFLGINGYNAVVENPEGNAHEISLTASDTEPASHIGEDEKRDNTLVADKKDEEVKVGSVNTIIGSSEVKKESVSKDKTSTKKQTTSQSKKTTNVVTKKEVKKTVTYAPAQYSSVTGDAIVNYAKKYLGLRYKSGTPSLTKGADCSGFTMLIFREFGVSLPRTVSGQIGRGTYVNKKDLQKGDLVFYKARGSSGGASHVGIYIGGGQVIHESRPGVGVKISTVNMMQYVTARRVINSKAKEIAEQKQKEEMQKTEVVADSTNSTAVDNQPVKTDEVVDNNVNAVTNTTTPSVTTSVPTEETIEVKEEQKSETVETKEEVNSNPSEEVNSQE